MAEAGKGRISATTTKRLSTEGFDVEGDPLIRIKAHDHVNIAGVVKIPTRSGPKDDALDNMLLRA